MKEKMKEYIDSVFTWSMKKEFELVYCINMIPHGLYYSNYPNGFEKGFLNMDEKYGHWIHNNILNYYL